jgi:CRP/FNR family transcriptional regulator, cyclic AMP receptor protein
MNAHHSQGAEMRTLSLIRGRATTSAETNQWEDSSVDEDVDQHKDRAPDCSPFRNTSEVKWESIQSPYRDGEFFQGLSTAAMSDFHSIASLSSVSESTALFREGEELSGVLFLLAGRVKLSVNSNNGGRLILGTAGPGEILGLTSAVLGCPYDLTAEAQFPCTIASVKQESFLKFLVYHSLASQNVARELSFDSKRTYGQLRTLGFNLSAPTKLARLFMSWCTENVHVGRGARIPCSFTHVEIGEHIGVSRETVTRTLNEFKSAGLIEQRGILLIVPDRNALAVYAGMDLFPPPRSAA